jgi:hypothetical protein
MRIRMLLLCGLLLSACGGTDNRVLEISGTVRTLTGERPIVGATLALSWRTSPFESAGATAFSETGGQYSMRIGPILCNNVTLTAAAEGHRSFTTGVECSDEPQQIDFTLAPVN